MIFLTAGYSITSAVPVSATLSPRSKKEMPARGFRRRCAVLSELVPVANQIVNGFSARIFTERRYKGEDNRLFSRKYFEMLKKQGFFNQ